jgi:hypothetical protein
LPLPLVGRVCGRSRLVSRLIAGWRRGARAARLALARRLLEAAPAGPELKGGVPNGAMPEASALCQAASRMASEPRRLRSGLTAQSYCSGSSADPGPNCARH